MIEEWFEFCQPDIIVYKSFLQWVSIIPKYASQIGILNLKTFVQKFATTGTTETLPGIQEIDQGMMPNRNIHTLLRDRIGQGQPYLVAMFCWRKRKKLMKYPLRFCPGQSSKGHSCETKMSKMLTHKTNTQHGLGRRLRKKPKCSGMTARRASFTTKKMRRRSCTIQKEPRASSYKSNSGWWKISRNRASNKNLEMRSTRNGSKTS